MQKKKKDKYHGKKYNILFPYLLNILNYFSDKVKKKIRYCLSAKVELSFELPAPLNPLVSF